jgi:hypothetical protein
MVVFYIAVPCSILEEQNTFIFGASYIYLFRNQATQLSAGDILQDMLKKIRY